ncbi:MAG: T9SS type A sorting domain-containing protein [Candidatus Latescibacter sp.]|nr:T9SS type A sorting domain-containing protein [Candidatus Latescibacter sp.]
MKSLPVSMFFFITINILFASAAYSRSNTIPLIIDHNCTRLSAIPNAWIQKAKNDLHIAYGHTSHGSQLISGMIGLVSFKGTLYSFGAGGANGILDLRDTPFSGAYDLGNPDRTTWATATRNYLGRHPKTNVIIWSWCGQVSNASKTDIDTYLGLMKSLENDYPAVSFVYMTGHHDGTGLTGNLHIRNEQIREYCRANNKILYDFNDIETYDPDGQYFGNKIPNDNCDYDSNGDGKRESNWAVEWQNTHPKEWYSCDSAHSQPLNANLKAYAAWWLWSSLAGWPGVGTDVEKEGTVLPELLNLKQNRPNPFNPFTAIRYELGMPGKVTISVYNTLGQGVQKLDLGEKRRSVHEFLFDGSGLTSGIYFYRVATEYASVTGKMLLMK